MFGRSRDPSPTAVLELGRLRLPSGVLVVTDMGLLDGWAAEGPPRPVADMSEDDERAAAGADDWELAGPDEERAAVIAHREIAGCSGGRFYDVPPAHAADLRAEIDEVLAGLDVEVVVLPGRISPHDRAVRAGDTLAREYYVHGVASVAVSGLPADRDLRVTACPTASEPDFFAEVTVHVADGDAVRRFRFGAVAVDHARVLFADVDALDSWQHDEPLDGNADVAFWGRDADQAAADLGAGRIADGSHGWSDLQLDDALVHHERVGVWMDDHPAAGLALDFRPHSHHYAVMRQIRERNVGAILLAGARMLGVGALGDGFFDLVADYDRDEALVALTLLPED